MPATEIPSREMDTQAVEETMGTGDRCPRLRKLMLWAAVATSVIGGCLWLVGTYCTRTYMTGVLDEHLWRDFSEHVRYVVRSFDSKYPHNVLLVLCLVHEFQVIFNFQLMHVTKMMYSYFFDTLHGGLIPNTWPKSENAVCEASGAACGCCSGTHRRGRSSFRPGMVSPSKVFKRRKFILIF
jgi:hypothetical protein